MGSRNSGESAGTGRERVVRQHFRHFRAEGGVEGGAAVARFGEEHAALEQELAEVGAFVFAEGEVGGAGEIEQRGFEHRGVG